ncbi:hypothetical protein ACEWY4_009488 [Coilia grayii]|uniref:Replication factor A C-terminal domain-containing protein n=1 Tax=Coilia grayii TaxID=363190 RepID=A0ABD1K6J6_9TELE
MSDTAFLCCTVLSVQDTSILYPSCSNCFSRVTFVSEEKSPRWSCLKCGRASEFAGYRYRLPLRVSKDCDVLGVTVFGNSLDSFFGAPAGQLHRFLTAIKESRGAQTAEWLLRKTLEDCFVGRCVRLGIKFPASVGEHRSTASLNCAPLAVSAKTEQYIAGKISLPSDGVFAVSVIQYLQSLLRVCAPSDGDGPREASLQSEQASYHDYTQLCPEGSCLHSSDADPANACFPLPVLQSPGLRSELGDSLGPSTPGQQGEPGHSLVLPSPAQGRRRLRRSVCDVSASKGSCRCSDGICARKRRVSVGQESGYSDNSRDGEATGSFSVPSVPDESWAHSLPKSFNHDALLAESFSTSFPQDNLQAGSSCSSSTKSPGSVCHRHPVHFRVVSGQTGSSTLPFGSDSPSRSCGPVFDSEGQGAWEKNMTATPEAVEHLFHTCEEAYNYSAELFDVSGLDRSDVCTSEKVPRRSRTSAHRYARPGLPLPALQSTPIVNRGARVTRRTPAACTQNQEESDRRHDPSFEGCHWETGSVIDSPIKCSIGEERCVSETSIVLTREEADWSRDLFIDP